jgi:predicted PurR-regulated permease PerM
MLEPIVLMWQKKLKLNRAPAIFLSFLIVAAVIGLMAYFIFPLLFGNIKEISSNIPLITEKYQSIIDKIFLTVRKGAPPGNMQEALTNAVESVLQNIQTQITGLITKILSSYMKLVNLVVDLVLSLVITFYILLDGETMGDWVLSLFPFKWRKDIGEAFRDISKIASDFLQGQFFLAMIVGALETVGLFFLNVKYPFALGLIGGLSNMIPVFGPIIGAVPSVAVAFIDSPWKALWVILLFVVVQQLDHNFLWPKIVGGKLGLHPVTTISAVIIGGSFFGFVGVLFAVPVFAMVKSIFNRITQKIIKRPKPG